MYLYNKLYNAYIGLLYSVFMIQDIVEKYKGSDNQ